MLRTNMRLIFRGLAAVAIGLACGWTLFAILPGKSSTPTTQTAAVTQSAFPKARVAVPAAEPEPVAPSAKPEPTPARIAEPPPSASTAPPTAPAAGERTKEVVRVRGKQRVSRRDDDDDDD
jgi:hypothetical protein